MAKVPNRPKKEKYELSDGFDEFDDLDNFGMGDDIDMQGADEKPNRKPTSKLKRLKEGAIEGFSSQLKSPAFQKELVKKALPEGYGKAMDTFNDVTDTAKTLYDNIATDIKPEVRELKKTLRKMLPGDTPDDPKSIKDRLKKFLDGEEEYRNKSRSQLDEENATMGTGEVFSEYIKAQSDLQDDKDKVDTAKENIKNTLSQNRFDTTAEHMTAIRTGIERLVGYQDKITINYQRKSLELQFKHLFTAQHHLDTFEKFAAISTQAYKDIVKNTALPDAQKLHESERAKNMLKNYGLSKLGGTARDFLGDMPNRMKKNLMDMGKDFSESLKMGLDQASMALEMMDMGGGVDPMHLAGNVAGGGIASMAGDKVAQFAFKHAQKMPKVMALGKAAGRISNELPARVNAWASDRNQVGPWYSELGKDIVGGGYNLPSNIRQGNNENLDKVAYFNHKTQMAITEVIPGWLARIYALQEKAAGGSGEMEHYDYAAGQFTKVKDTAAKLHEKVFDKSNIRYAREETEKMLNMLIPSKEDRDNLGKKARNALREMMLHSAANAGYFEPKHLVKSESFTRYTNGDQETANKLAEYFQGRFPDAMVSGDKDEDFGWNNGDDEELDDEGNPISVFAKAKKKFTEGWGKVKQGYKKATDPSQQDPLDQLSDQFFRMGNSYSHESRKVVLDAAKAGNLDAYRSLGVVGRKGDTDYFDHQKYMSQILDEDSKLGEEPQEGPTPAPEVPPKKPRSSKIHFTPMEPLKKAGYTMTMMGKLLYGSKTVKDEDKLDIILADNLVQEIRKNSCRDINQKILDLLTKLSNDSGGESGSAEHHHSGGVVGRNGTSGAVNLSAFKHARRYHSGGVVENESGFGEEYRFEPEKAKEKSTLEKLGERFTRGKDKAKDWLKKGEVPAVLQQDEEVLKRSDPRHIFNQAKAGLHNLDEKLTIKNYLHDIVTLLSTQAEISSMGFGMGLNINMTKAKGYFQRSMGTGLRVGKDVLNKGLGFFGKGLDFMKQMGVQTVGGAWTLGGKVIEQGKKLWDNRHEIYGHGQALFEKGKAYLGDLYIKGAEEATLKYEELKKGQYFDAVTGKVIKSWDDIKNGVKDKAGNTLMSAKQFSEGVYTNKGKPLLLRGIAFAKRQIERVLGISSSSLSFVKHTAKAAWNLFDIPYDVYLEGEMDEPKLYAHIIRSGGYFQKKTKKPVLTYKDIVGTIVDAKGAIVLGVREYAKKKLVNKDGKPLVAGMDRISGMVAEGFNKAKNFLTGGLDLAGKAVGAVGRGLSRMVGIGGEGKGGSLLTLFGSGNAMVVDRLEAIYKVLDERLPGGKKKRKTPDDPIEKEKQLVLDEQAAEAKAAKLKTKKAYELDEKGLRKGSWEEKEAMGKDKKGAAGLLSGKADPTKKDDKGGGMMALLLGAIGGLAEAVMHFGGAASSMVKGVWEIVKFIGKIPRGLWNVGKAVLGGARTAFNFAKGAAELLPEAGTVAEVAGSAIGGIVEVGAAILASPVTIPAVLTAATAYIGYKAFNYLLTKDNLLAKFRMISYGCDPDDKDHVGQIGQLENMLAPLVAMGNQGAVMKAGHPLSDLLAIFGIQADDKSKVKEWSIWFQRRFKPIFLAWMTGLNVIPEINGSRGGKKIHLDQVDDHLTAAQKIELMTKTIFPFDHQSPYSWSASPWSNGDKVTISPSKVKDAFDYYKDKIKKLGDKGSLSSRAAKGMSNAFKGIWSGLKKMGSAIGRGAMAVGKFALDEFLSPFVLVGKGLESVYDSVKDSAVVKGIASAAKAVGSFLNKVGLGFDSVKDAVVALPDTLMDLVSKAGGMLSDSAYSAYKSLATGTNYLTQFRMTQYGCDVTNKDRVMQIAQLEQMLISSVVMAQGGPSLQSKIPVSQLMAIFGVHPEDTDNAKQWSLWFENRFKPVFVAWMTYLTLRPKLTQGAQVISLTQVDQLISMKEKLALMALVAFTFDSNGPYSWKASPWPEDDQLSVSPSDVKDAYSEYVAKIKDLGDPSKAPGRTSKSTSTVKPGDLLKKSMRFGDKDKNPQKKMDDVPKAKDKPTLAIGRSGNGAIPSKLSDNITLGNAGRGMGKAKPMPTGKIAAGKWSPKASPTLDENIAKASQQTGVPASYLKTMALIESGGNPGAVSPTGAVGIYQFTKGTGKQYGLCGPDGDMRSDEAANISAGAQLAADNQRLLKHILGDEPEPWMLYMAHQQGAGGVAHILKAASSGMDVPSDIRHNMDVNGGQGLEPSQFLNMWKMRYAKSEQVANNTSPSSTGKPSIAIPGYNADGSPSKSTGSSAFKPGSKIGYSGGALASTAKPPSMMKASMVTGMPTPSSTRMDKAVTERNDEAVKSAVTIDTQRRGEAQNMAKSTGSMTDLMKQSLQVQQSMDQKLGQIAQLLQASQESGGAQPQAGVQPVNSNQAPPPGSQKVPMAMTPPISVSTRA